MPPRSLPRTVDLSTVDPLTSLLTKPSATDRHTAIYLRMSIDRTGEERGVERNREDCLALIARRGWTEPVEEYVDNDLSASDPRVVRPDYERLIADVAAGRVERIVLWQTSRLWRNRRERADGIELCRAARVSVIPCKGPELDLTTAYGRGMAAMIGEFDTMEVEVKSERQIREAQQRASLGEPAGGRRRFGYTTKGELIGEEAKAGRWAYEQLLAGRSLSSIARGLAEQGHTTTAGGPWRHNSVRAYLLNPANAGLRAYRGKIIRQALWDGLVTEDVWRAACTILGDSTRKTNWVGNALKWLGTGMYRCATGADPNIATNPDADPGCDTPLKATYRSSISRGTQYRIYKCMTCYTSRRAAPVDDLVVQLVDARLGMPDTQDLLSETQGDGQVEQLQAEAVALRERRQSLARLLMTGVLSEAEVRQEAEDADRRLAQIQEIFDTRGEDAALASILLADDPVQAWRATEGQVDRRRAIVSALMVVRLLPFHSGRRAFDPSTVVPVWRRCRRSGGTGGGEG